MAGIARHLDDIIRKYEGIHVLSDELHAEYLARLLRVVEKRAIVLDLTM
jgi:hypothetical protein